MTFGHTATSVPSFIVSKIHVNVEDLDACSILHFSTDFCYIHNKVIAGDAATSVESFIMVRGPIVLLILHKIFFTLF